MYNLLISFIIFFNNNVTWPQINQAFSLMKLWHIWAFITMVISPSFHMHKNALCTLVPCRWLWRNVWLPAAKSIGWSIWPSSSWQNWIAWKNQNYHLNGERFTSPLVNVMLSLILDQNWFPSMKFLSEMQWAGDMQKLIEHFTCEVEELRSLLVGLS